MTLKKMDSTEDQLAEMLREFKSRSKAKVIVESGLYALIVLFLFVGNFLTFLVDVKPTDANNSKHVRSITRCFRLIIRSFPFSAIRHSNIGDFPLAF